MQSNGLVNFGKEGKQDLLSSFNIAQIIVGSRLGLAKQDFWGLGAVSQRIVVSCPFAKMIPQQENHFGKRKACNITLYTKAPKILFCPPYSRYIYCQGPFNYYIRTYGWVGGSEIGNFPLNTLCTAGASSQPRKLPWLIFETV